jgi:hypothetical protein
MTARTFAPLPPICLENRPTAADVTELLHREPALLRTLLEEST